jgi:hypothetical protein
MSTIAATIFIDGKWSPAESVFAVRDPAALEGFARCAVAARRGPGILRIPRFGRNTTVVAHWGAVGPIPHTFHSRRAAMRRSISGLLL